MTPQPQSFALALVIMGFTAPGKRSDGSFSAKNGPADPRTGGTYFVYESARLAFPCKELPRGNEPRGSLLV